MALRRRIRGVVRRAEPQVERHPAREVPRVLPVHGRSYVVVVQPASTGLFFVVSWKGTPLLNRESSCRAGLFGPLAPWSYTEFEVVEPGLEFVIAPEQIRLVVADDALV